MKNCEVTTAAIQLWNVQLTMIAVHNASIGEFQ